MEAAKDAESDLKSVMAETKKINEEKKQKRDQLSGAQKNAKGMLQNANVKPCTGDNCRPANENNKDSLSEVGEEQTLKLQMVMDRMTKFEETASNILKKMSNTSDSILQNLK